ncbi:MAG: hypothetical protein CO013_05350 [Syntrophobacterales bacterium CG_4_8_14_3_um_filter_58_8]|nr:MAG: hypothetical protein AUK26_06995 [Syntrophaceae bacterium CG2_30_58_14]PIV02241.1 MAG: hypothetical protein COS57_13060 [Syntrophobacterales bacterium CG03_land_8_20_14_0_80_58_14]PJC74090.1 MAG: hypothetical protein CO013_05350 [Syntrophobacterales bacterium CG_4_8_14_3_um_filter_58_8]
MAEGQRTVSAGDTLNEIDVISKYDPELRFRKLTGITLKITIIMTQILSIFHIYTAGFGVLQEWRHRAFHLAFVLPLVYFYYSIRKPKPEKTISLVYDLIYGLLGSSLITAIFREILKLTMIQSALLALISFVLLLYFKRREFWQGRPVVYVDFVIFSAMLAGFSFALFKAYHSIAFLQVFRQPNMTLLFWSILLFATLLVLTLLFIFKWLQAVASMIAAGAFNYQNDDIPYFDVFMALFASAFSVFIFLEYNSLVTRAGLPLEMDLVIGGLAFVLILEGARRSIGPALPLIAFLVLVNSYLGPYFLDVPGLSFFAHRGYSIERIIEHMFLGTEGIYGIPLGVVATFVFHFVLFGIFISKTGLGQLFIDLAMALAGWSAGGPAKVAVISSGFMGSISGSSIANTVTTGAFTIPLMKKVGYRPQFAGAVEAAASTGGQIMPPIMGAAAFIMAEFLGIPYIKIATAAVMPALFHFFAVGTMVHLEARKIGLVGLPREMLPKVTKVLKEKWLLVGPLVIIVWLLVTGSSPFLAAFWGILFSVAIGQIHDRTLPFLVTILLSAPAVLLRFNPLGGISIWSVLWLVLLIAGLTYSYRKTDLLSWLLGLIPAGLLLFLPLWGVDPSLSAFWAQIAIIAFGACYQESKMRIPDIMKTLELGTKNALAIGAACACIGFIVGATTLTGLGLKFAAAIIELAQGTASVVATLDIFHFLSINGTAVFFTLIFTAVACFILGMGIPTTAQYIIASMIAAPALLQLGIHPLISHMFVFFYAILADVTPPVALAAYAASGISGADPFKTGLTAFGLASAGFIVPFVFVEAPILLWLPTLLDPSASFDFLLFTRVAATCVLGIIALGATVIGYFADRSTVPERIVSGISAALLIYPEKYSDIVGAVLFVLLFLYQKKRRKGSLTHEGAKT